MTVTGQPPSSETLSREACLRLLAGADLARVVLSVRALPAALPARICLIDDHLLLVSHEEAVLVAARRGDVVSVQIDGLEPDGTTWSVMSSGIPSGAEPDDSLRPVMREALENGATLLSIPLTLVVGQRSR